MKKGYLTEAQPGPPQTSEMESFAKQCRPVLLNIELIGVIHR